MSEKGEKNTLAANYVIIGAVKIARGTVKFSKWSAEMVKEFGESIKPHLAALYNASKGVADMNHDNADDFKESAKIAAAHISCEIESENTTVATRDAIDKQRGEEPLEKAILDEGTIAGTNLQALQNMMEEIANLQKKADNYKKRIAELEQSLKEAEERAARPETTPTTTGGNGAAQPTPELVRQATAARLCGISRSLLSLWVKRGRVSTVDVYGSPFVRLCDVKRAKANPRKGGRPKAEPHTSQSGSEN